MVSSIPTVVGTRIPSNETGNPWLPWKSFSTFLKHVINLLIYVSNLINILSMYPNRWSKSKKLYYTFMMISPQGSRNTVDHTDTKGEIFKRGNIIKLKGSIYNPGSWVNMKGFIFPNEAYLPKTNRPPITKKPSGLTCSPWLLPHSFSQQEKQAWGFQLVHCSPNGNSCWVL